VISPSNVELNFELICPLHSDSNHSKFWFANTLLRLTIHIHITLIIMIIRMKGAAIIITITEPMNLVKILMNTKVKFGI